MDKPHATPDPTVRALAPSFAGDYAERDIRHLVCRPPDGFDTDYLAARRHVLADLAAGLDSRIVLLTAKSRDAGGLPFDVPVDVIPAFACADDDDDGAAGFIFASARPGTVFLICDNGHPLLNRIRRGMLAHGIRFIEYSIDATDVDTTRLHGDTRRGFVEFERGTPLVTSHCHGRNR
uniref:Uncharacterized protein n=1 Tax=Rhodopseudomonas palustris (strain BisA53) TaxID=316055 RepID=Q07KV4_RHOP5